MEHAIAALLGVSASTFSIEPKLVALPLPQVPSGVPTTLLQRRPDIAAAQRRMIAANANIGVARAAYFPSLTLGAQGGFQSTGFSNWLSAPSSFWAIGPNALLSVFDGGLRRAQVAQARAEFDASAANYRGIVVTAFQQVEDRATDYLTVVTSQTALLQTQLESLNLDTLQLSSSVNLILALGGGWQDSAAVRNGRTTDTKQHG
jgi:outer membrane protein TolC